MRLFQAILLALGSFFWAAFQITLGPLSSRVARRAGRMRVSCLARMLVVGTGWGGDDAALQLFESVPDARGLLEEVIQSRGERGKDVTCYEFALRLVGVA